MKHLAKYGVAAAVGLGLLMTTTTASAQQSGNVISLDESVIEGRIQKPEAFYILQHAQLKYEKLEPKRSFIPELLDSVNREPF